MTQLKDYILLKKIMKKCIEKNQNPEHLELLLINYCLTYKEDYKTVLKSL